MSIDRTFIMASYKIVSITIKMLQKWKIDQTSKKLFAQTPYTPQSSLSSGEFFKA